MNNGKCEGTMTSLIPRSLALFVGILAAQSLHAHDHDQSLPKLPKSERSVQFMDALASAYATNSELQDAVAQQKVTAEGVAAAKSGWRPTINAQGSVSRTRTDSVDASQSAQGNPARNTAYQTTKTSSITASQNVFKAGGTVAAVSAAENRVRAGWAAFTNQEQNTLLGAASAFLNLFAAYEVLKLSEKNESYLKKQLESSRTRERLGEVTRTDVANAESELSDAIVKKITARADLESKKGTYFRIIGLEAPENLVLPKLPETLLPQDQSQTVNQSMVGNPQILQQDYLARAFYDDIGVRQADLLPSVDVQGQAARTVRRGSAVLGNRQNNYSMTATLSVPLYKGGERWAGLRSAQQQATQNKIKLQTARRSVRENSVKAWEDWVSARLRIVQLKNRIKNAKIRLDGVHSEFKEGERIFLDVLDAQRNLFNAQVDLENARRDLYIAAYTLLSLTGKMTATHLKLPVEKYDIEGHYNLVSNKWFGTTN